MRLIDADALRAQCDAPHWCVWMSEIDDAPTVDAVPVGVLEQIRWERDTAMQQLEEHGIPFCGKADDVVHVVRCGECARRYTELCSLSVGQMNCKVYFIQQGDDFFCKKGRRDNDG